MDLVLPRKADDSDESLAAFVRRRLGREALERLVQPLVGGIYTADPAELSLKATLPQFPAMEREHGSLIRGGHPPGAAGPSRRAIGVGARYGLFASLADGMDTLPKALAAALPPGTVRTGTAVRRISRPDPGKPWRVELLDGPPIEAGGVILTTEAHASARLIDGFDPELRLAAPLDPLRVVGDRDGRLSSRPGGPPARRLRRGRAGDRGAVDPGRLVPERQVPASGPGRDGADAGLRRRRHAARPVRPRRRGAEGPGPRASWRPARARASRS